MTDATSMLAERIAVGLRERKKIGDERRMQERDRARQYSENAMGRYRAARRASGERGRQP